MENTSPHKLQTWYTHTHPLCRRSPSIGGSVGQGHSGLPALPHQGALVFHKHFLFNYMEMILFSIKSLKYLNLLKQLGLNILRSWVQILMSLTVSAALV